MSKRKPIRSRVLWALIGGDGKLLCNGFAPGLPFIYLQKPEQPGYRPIRVRVVEEV